MTSMWHMDHDNINGAAAGRAESPTVAVNSQLRYRLAAVSSQVPSFRAATGPHSIR